VPPALATGGAPLSAPPTLAGGDAAFGASPQVPGAIPDPPLARGTGGGQTADPEHGGGPIYVWNPGAKTEEFHAVSSGLPPGGDNGQPSPAPLAGPAAAGPDAQAFPAVPPAGHGDYPAGHGDYPAEHGDYAEDESGYYSQDAGSGFPEEDEDDRHL
jgi:hypothetical protein